MHTLANLSKTSCVKSRVTIFVAAGHIFAPHSLTLLSLSAFPTTETELKLIAAAAIIGLSRTPKKG
jgi:hypothetical protein